MSGSSFYGLVCYGTTELMCPVLHLVTLIAVAGAVGSFQSDKIGGVYGMSVTGPVTFAKATVPGFITLVRYTYIAPSPTAAPTTWTVSE
jgi:hypothetical protein